jgi:non-ribosomal peptide synthetase component F
VHDHSTHQCWPSVAAPGRAAFVPLDAQWPLRRIQHVVSCAGLDLIVLTGSSPEEAWNTKQQLGLSVACRVMTVDEIHWHLCRVMTAAAPGPVCAVSLRQLLALNTWDTPYRMTSSVYPSFSELDLSFLTPFLGPDITPAPCLPWCYVMFTSGSTGQPLGAMGTEEGILNRCHWMHTQDLISAVRLRCAFFMLRTSIILKCMLFCVVLCCTRMFC